MSWNANLPAAGGSTARVEPSGSDDASRLAAFGEVELDRFAGSDLLAVASAAPPARY